MDNCYDGSKIITNPYLFKEDNKIKEYIYKCTGMSGNGQRNYALSKIRQSGYVCCKSHTSIIQTPIHTMYL